MQVHWGPFSSRRAAIGSIAFCFALWTPCQSQASERYVSPSGDDSHPGTSEAPWRTLQKACDSLGPGDTAHVAAGIYNEKITVHVSGSADGGFVSLEADGNVILSGEGVRGAHLIEMLNRSYVRIVGFDIQGLEKARDGSGIRIEGQGEHIQIRNNRIHNIRGKDAMAITVYGKSPVRSISNLVIDGNEIYDCEPAKSETLTLNGNIEKFEVTNNHVHDVNNIGIDFIGGENWVCSDSSKVARDGVCRGNRVERARSNYGGGYAAGIYVDGGRDIVIENNVVSGCNLGIEIGAENEGIVTSGITVRNNILYGNDKAGLAFGGYEANTGRVRNSTFTGNTCYQNGTDIEEGQGELWIQFASNCTVTGNTFCTKAGSFLVQCVKGSVGITIDRNIWYSGDGESAAMALWRGVEIEGFSRYRKISGQDAHSVFRQPKFQNPASGDFTQASPPAEP
jgi:hypothetical protein